MARATRTGVAVALAAATIASAGAVSRAAAPGDIRKIRHQTSRVASAPPHAIQGERHVLVLYSIDRNDVEGVVNVAAPNPLSNAEFMRLLREACGGTFGLPASRWMLEIGAVFLRTETELILKSRRVVPARLLEQGFTFKFPAWGDAARDLCHQWEMTRTTRSSAA